MESHFDVNVKGLYLALRAAADAGVRKVVHASSLSIFEKYLAHGRNLQTRIPDATDAYGLTKRLGEQVCESMMRERGLPIVSLRLCGPLPDDEWRTFNGRCPRDHDRRHRHRYRLLAGTRIRQYCNGYETFIITGDHEHRYIDHSHTRDWLGWQPMMRRETQPEGLATP